MCVIGCLLLLVLLVPTIVWLKYLYDLCQYRRLYGYGIYTVFVSTDDCMYISVYAILVNTQTFRKALTASVHDRTDTGGKIECPFSCVNNYARVWMKGAESKAWSVVN